MSAPLPSYPAPDPAHLAQVAEAFSRKATLYDSFGDDHPVLARMRGKVRDQLLRYVQRGDHLLELNAGTGADALYFAQAGLRVHATDIAPGMIAQIEAKIAAHALQDRLTVQQCSFTQLDQVTGGPYQAVLSNMGGLNCIADLHPVVAGLRRLLSPGAVVLWVIMPPFCLWELAALLVGDWRTATRRWWRRGTLAHVEGVRFMTYYFTPRAVIKAFGPDFQLLGLQGLGVVTPPADRKRLAHRLPRFYRMLCRIDDMLACRRPWHGWGDFFMLTMRYSPHADNAQ